MKALSFLGTSDYQSVTYLWEDTAGPRTCQTHLFPEAVARIFEPERLIVFVTPEATEAPKPRTPIPCPECGHTEPTQAKPKHLATLAERLGNLVESVDIPPGRSETELWQIFETCAESVEEGEDVLLDVTHAFRSLPLVVFAVAAYLRRTKHVILRHIVYGAFEARDHRGIAPVFDLIALVDLLDWVSGAEGFLQLGNATLLGSKLEETHRRLRVAGELPVKLQKVGNQLGELSMALSLNRPREIMERANRLLPMLDDVAEEAGRWAKPFAVILAQVRHNLRLLAHEAPDRLDSANLCVQLQIIEHYVEKRLIMQAVTLSREWVVSLVALRHGQGDWLDRGYRIEVIERALNSISPQAQGESRNIPDWVASWSEGEKLGKFWNHIAQLRNDLAHCGMNHRTTNASKIERLARAIPDQLRAFYESELGEAANAFEQGRRKYHDTLRQLAE